MKTSPKRKRDFIIRPDIKPTEPKASPKKSASKKSKLLVETPVEKRTRAALLMAAALIREGEDLDGLSAPTSPDEILGRDWLAGILHRLSEAPRNVVCEVAGIPMRGRPKMDSRAPFVAVAALARSSKEWAPKGLPMAEIYEMAAASLGLGERAFRAQIAAGIREGIIRPTREWLPQFHAALEENRGQ